MLINLAIILATNRPGNQSQHVAKLIEKVANSIEDFGEIKLIDPTQFKFPEIDGNDEANKIPEWVDINKWADAYFIVAPEYNHGYPGTLKRLLDNDLGNYNHKPVAFAGVSAGPWGGTRVIESLLHVVRELGMMASGVDLNFPAVQNAFDDNGELTDQAYIKRVERVLKELIWLAKSLQWGRNNL